MENYIHYNDYIIVKNITFSINNMNIIIKRMGFIYFYKN